MERTFKVVRKFKEETEKGFKYGVRFSNAEGDNLALYFTEESALNAYEIDDLLIIKIVNPQTTL